MSRCQKVIRRSRERACEQFSAPYLFVSPAEESVGKLAALQLCVLRDSPLGRSSAKGKSLMALRKTPHPEEAAKQLSRRTQDADPSDRRFPDTRTRGSDRNPL